MNNDGNPFNDIEIDPFTGEVSRRNNGGGAVILVFALIPLIMASTVFLAVIFPLAGCGALAIGGVTEWVIGLFAGWPTDDPIGGWTTDDLARLTVMILASMVALFCLLPLERWVSRRYFRYFQVRHWVRVVGLPIMINEAGIDLYYYFTGQSENIGGHGLLDGVTAGKLFRIAILAVCVHVVFRLIDTRGRNLSLRQRLEPPGYRAGAR